ncbi:hypothetical protein D3C80_1697840 [compost metagenome]
MQNTLRHGLTEASDTQRKEHQRQGRRHSETKPGRQRARVTRARQPQRHTDLTAGRAGQKLAERHQIGITALTQPAATADELIAKVAKMGNRPTKRGQTQAQENQKDLQRAAIVVEVHEQPSKSSGSEQYMIKAAITVAHEQQERSELCP